MLGQVAPTEYDVRFSLAGIPVRVHPLFWGMALLLGVPRGEQLPGQVLLAILSIWVGCLFVSILVHELGHALMARCFRCSSEIVLYHLGGYAEFRTPWQLTAGRSILISLAGPAAGLTLYALCFLGFRGWLEGGLPLGAYGIYAFMQLTWINLWWSLLNLLPVYPLDGGQALRAWLMNWMPYRGLRLSLQISVLTSAVAAGYFISRQELWAGVLFAVLTVEALQHVWHTR